MGVWKQIAALPNPRVNAASCFYDGKVYVFGGQDNAGAYQSTTYIYDLAGNTWSSGASSGTNGLAYAFSTETDGVHLIHPTDGTHRAYDPATNTWASRTPPPGVARLSAHHFTDADGYFYLAGGADITGNAAPVRVTRYDPTTNSWTALADMPSSVVSTPGFTPGVLGSDNKIYLCPTDRGGTLIAYDPATNTWSTTAAMPAPISVQGANLSRLPSGVVLALPRRQYQVYSSTLIRRVDGYDPSTGLWSMGVTPDYPGNASSTSVATEPGGIIYLLGGRVTNTSGVTVVTSQAWTYQQNEAPTVATLLTLTGGVLVNTGVKNRARHQFNDPNVGDSQSKFDWRHRIVGTTSWTTGTVESPNPWYDIDAGDLDPGDYERQVQTYDAAGLAAPWTASGFFTAADPPDGPTITYPINGQTVEQIEHVDWSAAAQDSYQVRRVADDAGDPDPSTVYFDTAEVVDTLTRTLPLEFDTNGRDEHVQVRVKLGGLWSDWVDVGVEVTYTPPMAPTFAVYPDEPTGSLLIMITNPEPTGDEPAAAYNDVWIDDGTGFERKATQLATNTGWRYWTPISGRDYLGAIRVVAVAANGTTASNG